MRLAASALLSHLLPVLLLSLVLLQPATFARAATSSRPANLPAKKKNSTSAARPAPKEAQPSEHFATKLPAFKGPVRHKIDFTKPSLNAVVTRELDKALADANESTNADVQTVTPRRVDEAPFLEVVDGRTSSTIGPRKLKPAFPSSDEIYLGKSPVANKPAEPQDGSDVSEKKQVAAPVAIGKLQTETQIESDPVPEAVSVAVPVSVPPAVSEANWETSTSNLAVITQADESAHHRITEVEPSKVVELKTENYTETKTATASETVSSPFPNRPLSEQSLDSDRDFRSNTPPSAQLKKTFLIPSGEIPKRRLFIRTGYLDAKYENLKSDLRNGATTFGVSASQVFSQTEVRLGLDFVHGLDQAISLRTTRMAMLRGEGLFTFFDRDTLQAFAGGVVGLADIDVTSYRRNAIGEAVLQENAKGTALVGSPVIGGRARVTRELTLDLSAQYLLFAGGDEITNLGGLLAELALGFRF